MKFKFQPILDADPILVVAVTFAAGFALWGLVRLLRALKIEKDVLLILAVVSVVLFALAVRYGFTIWRFIAK